MGKTITCEHCRVLWNQKQALIKERDNESARASQALAELSTATEIVELTRQLIRDLDQCSRSVTPDVAGNQSVQLSLLAIEQNFKRRGWLDEVSHRIMVVGTKIGNTRKG